MSLGEGVCSDPFILKSGESCRLKLLVNGAQMTASALIRPKVCQEAPNGTPSPYLCYQTTKASGLNVTYHSSPLPATLTVSESFMGLSVLGSGALTGVPRTFTITNSPSSPIAAGNVQILSITPGLPSGTSSLTTPSGCGTLNPGSSCTVTVTPGSVPSAAPGAKPNPSVFLIAGNNTNQLDIDVDVLTYGSIYQNSYLFSMNDGTPNTGSIGGTGVA